MGGFAPKSWVKSGNFFGDASSFLFSVYPKFFVSKIRGKFSTYSTYRVTMVEIGLMGHGARVLVSFLSAFGLNFSCICDV